MAQWRAQNFDKWIFRKGIMNKAVMTVLKGLSGGPKILTNGYSKQRLWIFLKRRKIMDIEAVMIIV